MRLRAALKGALVTRLVRPDLCVINTHPVANRDGDWSRAAYRDVLRVLSSMALLDAAAVGGAIQRMEQGRAGGMARLAQRLADQEALRADVSAGQAAGLLWLLTSFDSFDLLYTGRDLSIEKTAATLITTADRSRCR